MSHFIQYKNAKLHYQVTGNGSKPLLAFHGFGQTKEIFSELSETLSKDYTLYSFDLFFHGKSEWKYEEKSLEKDFWKELLNQFLVQNNIDSFSILGYSMGGKFALATIEGFPLKVKEVFLLAPDGIKTSPWYTLATYPVLIRRLFKSMILNPTRFQLIADISLKIGLIDKGILRFIETQMNTEEKRKQVYLSWVVFRHLKFSMSHIAGLINTNNIRVTAIAGKHDKIMKPKHMKRLLGKLRTSSFEVLDVGHNGLIPKWSEAQKLLQK